MANQDEEIAKRIKTTREQRGISQDGLAQSVAARGHDFRQQTVYKIESNQRRVMASELVAIADALGVPAADLLGLGTDRAPILLAGSRLQESQKHLDFAATSHARAMLDFARAADAAESLHASDERFAREGLLKQTPAWLVSTAVLNLEATLNLNRVDNLGPHALEVIDALRVDYNHFHGKNDG